MFYDGDIQLAIDTYNYGKTPPIAKGVEAKFYHLCRNVGFKLYDSEWSRNTNHERLLIGNQRDDFCVKVGPQFQCEDSYRPYYGFLVEQLDITLFNYAIQKFSGETNAWGSKILGAEGGKYCRPISEMLAEIAERIGLTFFDNHANNIAANLDENGDPIQWLAIDLGEGESETGYREPNSSYFS